MAAHMDDDFNPLVPRPPTRPVRSRRKLAPISWSSTGGKIFAAPDDPPYGRSGATGSLAGEPRPGSA